MLMPVSASHSASLLLLAATVIFVHRKLNAKKHLPGPPGHILVGHVFKIPPSSPWKTFAEWSKQYGDLISIYIFGQPMIICNTFEIAKELLDKRGANYSDRPPIMAAEMLGWENTMVLLRYNDRWRKQRRIMTKSFDQQASRSFRHAMLNEAEKFVRAIVGFEGDPRRHVHRHVAGAISLASYGHEVMSDDDELIIQMEKVAQISTTVGTPGQTPVDIFPFLRFFPTWLPGAGYLRKLEAGKILTHTAFVSPVELVKGEIEARTAKESFIAQLLEEYETEGGKDKEHEEDIAALGGILFLAGAETSETTLNTFFLMMVHHPEIARRAQAELDAVTEETNSLPAFTDKDRIPYIDCIVKELYRYNPPIPLGIPHRALEDDVYEGCTIPSGSMVIANLKQMMRDERYYPNPDRFFPDRFIDLEKNLSPGLDQAAADPSKILFGFGRRICPGRFFADDIIWLTIASVLSVFDILPALDSQTGIETLPKIQFTEGVSSQPAPYVCRVVPRPHKFAALSGARRT